MERKFIVLNIHVIPGSKLNQIAGLMDNGSLKIKIKAKPIEGKANKELIKVVADFLKIKGSEIEICSGQTSRNKGVKIWGIDNNYLQKMISTLIHQEP
jgi:uncharacterized protein (TIGR00251 family)